MPPDPEPTVGQRAAAPDLHVMEPEKDRGLADKLRWARIPWKRVARVVVGVVFLLLGLAGLVLPVLQGLLFLAIGALLLAPDVPIFRRMMVAMFRRWPKVRRAVPERMRRWVRQARADEG